MTDSPFIVINSNRKSFDFSPWGGIEGFLEASKAGAVGNTSALKARVPDLLRAVDMTASAVASLPFDIVDEEENVIDSSVDWHNVMGGISNPQRLLYLITSSLCGGSAYVIPTRTPKMIFNLQHCAPETIQPYIDRDGLQWFDRATQQGTAERLQPDELLHFWLPDSDVEIGPALSSPMSAAAQAAGLTQNMSSAMDKISQRGFIPPTVLAVTGGINDADRKKTEAWWNSFLRGAFQQIAKIINAEKMDIKQVGAGMEQLKGVYVELKREAKEDIAQAFGIPSALFMSDNAFASEFNALVRQWYSASIFKTIYMTIEETMSEQLLKPYGYYWRFTPDALDAFQDDEATRATAMQQLTGAVDKSPKTAKFVMNFLGYDFDEEQEAMLDELITEKEAQAQQSLQMEQAAIDAKKPQADMQDPAEMPMDKKPMMGKSIILTDLMVKDLKTWADMAKRWYKKGKGKAEDFECKALPDEIANPIREKLKAATNYQSVADAFQIGEHERETVTQIDEIKVLADAINHAADKAIQQPNNITINTPPINLTAQMPAQGTVTVNVPEQPAPQITVNVPQQKAPTVNIQPAVNNIEVKPADVVIDKAPQKKVDIQVTRDYSGRITGAQGAIEEK